MPRIKKMTYIKKYYEYDADANFQTKWIIDTINEKNMTFSRLAKILRCSRQAISLWVLCDQKMSFFAVCAICKLLDLDDDPYEIYNKIEEDWNGRTIDQGTGEQT